MIENAIQCVQEHIRAVKLDLDASLGVRLHLAHALWPWLIEFASQTISLWIINSSDGLTAIQRKRGTSRMSPKTKFGDQILYKLPKHLKLWRSEPRWKRRIWLGSIEASDEHIVGTALGVINDSTQEQ